MTEIHHDSGYEKSDVSVNKLVLWGVLSVVILTIIVIFIMDFFVATREELIYEQQLRPESVALRELRAHEAETLNSYRIIDSTKGKYQIPIKRAMQLMADEAYLYRREKSGN